MGKKSLIALVTVMLLALPSITYAWGFGRFVCDDYSMDSRCQDANVNGMGLTSDWYDEMWDQSGGWPRIEAIITTRGATG